MKNIITILIVFLIISCNQAYTEVIELQISKSSIPEGITVDPDTKEIFISSINEDNVTRSTPDGKKFSTVLSAADNGFSSGVGIGLWNHKLYALGSYKRGSHSILSIKDLKSNLISTYKLKDTVSTYFNDLAIDNQGHAYITDTQNHSIYRFDNFNKEIRIYLEHDEIKYPNGIAISDDQSKLFIDSYLSGIRIVDIKSRKILNEKHEPTIRKGIDGLKYWNRNLFFIINGGDQKEKHGLYKLKLSYNETEFEKFTPKLVNHEEMNIPTTISIVDNFIYILANSQMDNLDQKEHKIIDKKKLQKTNIIKLKIKESD